MTSVNAIAGSFLHHPASILVAVVLCLFVLRQISSPRRSTADTSAQFHKGPSWAGCASGVLLGNGLVHYLHGASGAAFPAPFAFLFSSQLAAKWLNVAWGTFCVALSLRLALQHGPRDARRFASEFIAGFALIGVVLAYIFGS